MARTGHDELLVAIRRAAKHRSVQPGDRDSYNSGGHAFYGVSVPDRRLIAKTWLAANAEMDARDVIAVVESLFAGQSHEEKTLAAILLQARPAVRREVHVDDVDRWLSHVAGWAEVDSLCQSVFTEGELLADWSAWRALIVRLSRDPNINKRRASLVLLTGPVRRSADTRFRDLGLEMIDVLKSERDILITKAVSWLLRSMVTHHCQAVCDYVDANEATLPKIAVRETRVKVRTGTKSGRRRATT